ncbi:hypothetical protein [Paenibacillus mesotrionivorans]|uniref:Uncharacterized protein n=1 Tax=Paenibacillus mesotrionivorans TaxID=3160968 RepID=A0ACC7P3G3_9BACL
MNSSYIKIMTAIIIVISMFSISACGAKSGNKAPVVESHADWHSFKSIEELALYSDLIVVGVVEQVKNPVKRNMSLSENQPPLYEIATLSDVKVTEVLKGNVKGGDLIEIKQEGGLYEGTQYVTDGVEFVKEKGEYILFLRAFDKYKANVPYAIINPKQGLIQLNAPKVDSNSNKNAADQNKNSQQDLFNDKPTKEVKLDSIKKAVTETNKQPLLKVNPEVEKGLLNQ